jgi:NADH-quinone oxidoreductase subunit J
MTELVFYFFASLLTISSILVISLRNPVHAVLFLIFAFFNAAALFIMIGAEFIAMTLVIVYVGAVAVLFLFVVMMLNINLAELKKGFHKHLPLGLGLAGLIFIEIIIAINHSLESIPQALSDSNMLKHQSNTHAIGSELYTNYFFVFQASGVVLLIAMIGAIVLTLLHSKDVRRQNIHQQILRNPADTIELIKVKSGKGVKV